MSLFKATRYVASVPLIDLDELVERGVRCILIDRDNTLVPRDTKVAPRECVEWLDRARELGVDKVDHAMKPAPFALWRAMRLMGVAPEECVMVGDQVFTDLGAGNLAGCATILVRPQSRVDLFYTQLFRVFENLALRGVTFEGEDGPSK